MKPSFLLIGLGNPGTQYAKTRHNIGWLAIDAVHEDIGTGDFADKPRFQSAVAEAESCLLVKPLTFMNRSGEAIRKITEYYKLDPALQILVCCDDIDLPLGTHRLRMSGGPGTHNGLKSIVECIGENFPRLRIGIGPKPEGADLAAWVLSNMTQSERKAMQPSFSFVKTAMEEVQKQQKKI